MATVQSALRDIEQAKGAFYREIPCECLTRVWLRLCALPLTFSLLYFTTLRYSSTLTGRSVDEPAVPTIY